ncbi:MAG: FecR domain-containing protein [Bacteroidota bacterium]
MLQFTSLFIRQDVPKRSDEELDAILRNALNSTRSSDPDTRRQWLRLRNELSEAPAGPATRRIVPRFALAGALTIAAVAGLILILAPPETTPGRYVTARAERSHVLLSDSSEVTLSHTTELVVQHLRPGEPRRLALSGEAYFRVRRNQTPFIVTNGFAEISVLGTEFNVRSRDGELEVAVLHGTVQVVRAGSDEPGALTLTQGQRARGRRNEQPVRIEDVPSPEYPGWMHGKMFLTRASLSDVCREIESRFDVNVTVPDDAAKEEITGILDATSAESAITALSLLTGKTWSRDDRTYTLR